MPEGAGRARRGRAAPPQAARARPPDGAASTQRAAPRGAWTWEASGARWRGGGRAAAATQRVVRGLARAGPPQWGEDLPLGRLCLCGLCGLCGMCPRTHGRARSQQAGGCRAAAPPPPHWGGVLLPHSLCATPTARGHVGRPSSSRHGHGPHPSSVVRFAISRRVVLGGASMARQLQRPYICIWGGAAAGKAAPPAVQPSSCCWRGISSSSSKAACPWLHAAARGAALQQQAGGGGHFSSSSLGQRSTDDSPRRSPPQFATRRGAAPSLPPRRRRRARPLRLYAFVVVPFTHHLQFSRPSYRSSHRPSRAAPARRVGASCRVDRDPDSVLLSGHPDPSVSARVRRWAQHI